ncbi:DUF2092 domain-containing protein [Sulfurovum sp. CS9]|uniref:DUF2092 domain-containing protein n=1 Tax=Sulfurovum sp. CS9 TaxID=3391146 RepID=UPI0039EC385C
MNLHKKLLCTAGVALLLSSTSLFAADKSARDILNNAYQYIGGMDKYAFTAVVIDDEMQDGETTEKYKHTVSVKVDRPGKLRVETTGTVKNRSNYLNEGSYTMIDHGHNYYGQIKTPKTIDASLDVLFEKFGIRAPLAQLIYSDMDKRVKFRTSKYFGTKDVAGVECDYVAFKNGTKEVHVWIATGDKPLVKSYSIIDTSTDSASRINTSVTWNTNANTSDSDFVFVAPKGSSKISVNRAK